ncbi:PAS domain-containing sensor histidine kinase [Pseudomonas sp. R5(2019)]|uniref:hybrid sensor histidine kinase/response regulator n=1 Tax=Pseudomonas sp. R5(2019) TaxID=2697566 RepID=UPI0014123B65|nr:PAS domain-containing sensor histidine kinase [Pseudomonas sp. R5(2019)]NBA96309.1 PAS domain-containing protein [Pseudomonas sp. R5(2019)]
MQVMSFDSFPNQRSEMSDKVRAFDWGSTSLGPMHSWPAALRIAVDMLLVSKFPGCLVWGPELLAIYNDGFRPILGDKPEALGRRFDDIWAEAWDTIGPIALKAYRGEATFIENFPLVVNRNQPEQAWFTFCYSPVRDENGRVVGMLDTVVETTEQVRAQQQVKALAEKFERQVVERTADLNRVWEMSSDLMLVTRTDLTITATNPAWQRVVGWSESELVGRSILDFVHPQDMLIAQANVARLVREAQLTDTDCRLLHKDGSARWINWAAVSASDCFSAVGRDVTEEHERAEALQRAEQLLRHSQKMEAVGQLTGGLAHDFNNLLTGISGSLELLKRRVDEGRSDDLQRYIDAAQGAAVRAATLTHRLLAFARRQSLLPEPTDINQLIDGMDELIHQTIGRSVTLELDLTANLWPVMIDSHQLEGALLNLCINARDAMPLGGRLSISTRNYTHEVAPLGDEDLPLGDYGCLQVLDTGCGMSREVIERAFDPFFTTKPVGQGTGLGLSMVYGFARQSGGRVRIESAPGPGAALTLYLPRHQVV